MSRSEEPQGNEAGQPSQNESAGVDAPADAVTPAPEQAADPADETLQALEALDVQSKEAGAFELVSQLEYAPLPKRKKRAANAEDHEGPKLEIMSVREARSILEAFLFTTNEPLSVARLSRLMNNLHPRTVRGMLLELQMDYDNRGGALQISEVAGGFQMSTRPTLSDWVFRLHRQRRRNPLTTAALETLAIIAYKQPITRAEIETIRGVESSATVHTLEECGLIEVRGRREVPGRPQLYATTDTFLKTFGLKSLAELPSIQELKQLFAEQQKLQATIAQPSAETPSNSAEDAIAPTEETSTPDMHDDSSDSEPSDPRPTDL
jgi:segregation and condensation protein B